MPSTNHIISVSLKQDVLDQIAALEKTGFSGRSEVIRAGVRFLERDRRERERLSGVADAVLTIVYAERCSADIQNIQHSFGELIRTKLHNHLEHHRCMEILVLHGEGKQIRGLADKCQAQKGVELVKLAVL